MRRNNRVIQGPGPVINFFLEYRKIIISVYTLLLFISHGLNIFVIYYMSQKLNIRESYNVYYFINEGFYIYTLCTSLYFLNKWTRELLDYNLSITIIKIVLDATFLIINMFATKAEETVSYCMLVYSILSTINLYIVSKMQYYFMRFSRPSQAMRRRSSRKIHPENKEISIKISQSSYECTNHSVEECENCLCSICLEEMNDKIVHNTQCDHTFHKECIIEHIKINITGPEARITSNLKCPNCREILLFETEITDLK